VSTVPLGDATLADLAHANGVCIRPVMRTVTDRVTDHTTVVAIPCGSTRDTRCPPCATKAKRLRAHQCAEGWHLDTDPLDAAPGGLDDDPPEDGGDPTVDDTEHERLPRRARSTRRRTDAADLPKLPAEHRSVGATFSGRDGVTYRPSMFVTLTLGSYGPVIPGRGIPRNPDRYDYHRAALDALNFPKLVDRWWQNLRRCAGYKVQYFAVVEPQRRLTPHLHTAIRGAIPRQTLRAVTKATYVQLWWPPHTQPVYVDRVPLWDRVTETYRDPDTGRALPTWDQALDALDDDPAAEPAHVMRFGQQLDVQGIIAPSPAADRTVRYLTKYLTKAVAGTYADPDEPDPAYEAHVDRLHREVRWLPCSPGCANWLRYGVQPEGAGPGLIPGQCASKAHDRECASLGGRRVLVSRHWTGKTLTEHRADRATVVRETLEAAGITPPEARRMSADTTTDDGRPRYTWAEVDPRDRRYDYPTVIAASITQARRWRQQYEHARDITRLGQPPGSGPLDTRSATHPEEGTAA
jgi:hypothetical protein